MGQTIPPGSRGCCTSRLLVAEHVFETVSSENVYRGRILALRVDHVRMPGGATATREVVEHFGAVAIAAVDDKRRIPLIYQYRHPLGKRLWELPAGLLDAGGEDPLATAKRELQEETGLAAQQWRTLVDLVASPGFSDEAVRVYLAEQLSEVDRPQAEHEEADLTMQWFAVEDAVEMVMRGQVVNSTAVAGILALNLAVSEYPTRAVDAEWPDRPTVFASGQVSQ